MMPAFVPTFVTAFITSAYKALAAENGEAALENCRSSLAKIDLVMTDLVMPGMGGQELARKLPERFPKLHVLFTSSYTADGAVRRELLQSGNSFLEKPYTAAALSDTVGEALVKQHPRRNAEDEAEVVNNSTAAR